MACNKLWHETASVTLSRSDSSYSRRRIKNDTLAHMCRSQGLGLWGSLKKRRPRKRVFKQTGLGGVTSTLLIYIMAETRVITAWEMEVSRTSSVNKAEGKIWCVSKGRRLRVLWEFKTQSEMGVMEKFRMHNTQFTDLHWPLAFYSFTCIYSLIHSIILKYLLVTGVNYTQGSISNLNERWRRQNTT